MINKFVKDIKEFYTNIYNLDFRKLTLHELENIQNNYKKFLESDLLKRNQTEEDKIYNLIAFDCIGFFNNFCIKSKLCKNHLRYFDDLLNNLQINFDSVKNFIIQNKKNELNNRIINNLNLLIDNDENMLKIIFEDNLDEYNYLYYYGKKITDNHKKIVDFFNKVEDSKITSMAECTVDCFLRGMKHSNIDVDKKDYVLVYYPIGYEKMVKRISEILKGKLNVVFKLFDNSEFDKQLNYNHRYDYCFYLDKEYIDKYLEIYDNQAGSKKENFSKLAGRIFIETFGETRFVPKNGDEVFEKIEEKTKLDNELSNKYGILYQKYVRDNTSFTIISYPCPEIGKDFEDIFEETIKINTLDNSKYEKIHQKIIDVLDKSKYVLISGRNGNKTNLRVELANLEDPETQTIFENCCADVNVPVGEVFTSPKLKGTNGILHVSEIYLNGWKFENLYLEIEDGFIKKYSCTNFKTEEENKQYINEHLLFDYPTLPMGEFAIGTNTTAYVMANKYNINDKMDILIAEKTGPHFAFGDTCFSMDEDVKVYNPDGKEMIAKDNEVSRKRNENIQEAYYSVHTDVTIPYSELGDIVAINGDIKVKIIENGKFVLEGTEELNIDGI